MLGDRTVGKKDIKCLYLFLGQWGRLGTHLWGMGDAVGLLISHGNDGGEAHHRQVGHQALVQAAADVLVEEGAERTE